MFLFEQKPLVKLRKVSAPDDKLPEASKPDPPFVRPKLHPPKPVSKPPLKPQLSNDRDFVKDLRPVKEPQPVKSTEPVKKPTQVCHRCL